MNGLLISMIFFVVVMMGVTFVLVTTIVAKITENSRNVKRREDYIVGKKKEEKKTGHRFLKEECQLALLSFSKAGAKVRTLKHNFQMFRKFFFTFLFQDRSSERNLWQRREKWKLTAPFYCQNVKTSPPSFPKADAKVALLRTSAKYIQAFFEGLRELFHN